ncbi:MULTISPECIES: fumarylacetoacetate hydrolase family protein [Paraburkholderia]|uniref:fumarylacetoacetate hydrolase family protein n=1 Tax=Paraburkholderia TaxID=1822464 RepID=UPI003218B557
MLLTTHAGLAADAVGSVAELLRRHGDALPALSERLLTAARAEPSARVGHVDAVRLGPPIPVPAKVLCIGLNYRDHVAETGRADPKAPDVFAKFASTLIGPMGDIDCTAITSNLDFEGELAIVIGRPCRHVDAADALSYVAGFTILNDITARDLQYKGTQWLAGKALDSSTPCGPALVTLDEIGDPQRLDLSTRVNGIVMQSSNTERMIFPIRHIISYISYFLALNPGDIIATGTPEGIGSKRTPPVWLKAGDTVEVQIEKLGCLRNVVR